MTNDLDFYDDKVFGEKGEKIVEAYMKKQNIRFERTDHTKYKNKSFEADYYLGAGHFAETKCSSGTWHGIPCSTLVVEKYKNINNPMYSKKIKDFLAMDKEDVIYPGWIRTIDAGKNLTMYFVNKYDSYIYIFDGKKLYDYVKDYDDAKLTVARNKNTGSDSGLIAKIGWEDVNAGFIKKVKFRQANTP